MTFGPELTNLGSVISWPSRMAMRAIGRRFKQFNDVVGGPAAMIIAFIYYDSLFVNLSKEVAVEISITA